MRRRKFIATSTLLLAGCSEQSGSDSDVQDSDGDGVIDTEDYAPNDADVQEKSDMSDSGESSTQTDTPTDTPPDTPTDTPTATETPAGFSYDKTEFVPGPGYYSVSFGRDSQFIINWTVTNQRSSEYDFDVVLMSESEFQTYVDYVNDESSHRPEYYADGSRMGVTDEATRTATLAAGDYRLVVDNSDYGDAGDVGDEASRKVRIQLSGQET